VEFVPSREQDRVWEFVAAPARSAPGVTSMVGYRAFGVPGELHRGIPSATLTFIVSLDDGVEAAATAQALQAARPNPLVLSGLQDYAAHVRQRPGQAGVQLAVHPLAARALFGLPSSELRTAEFDATTILGRRGIELRERVIDAGQWRDAFDLISEYLIGARRRSDDAMVRPEVAFAWKLLQRSRGRVAVSTVADRVDMTTRHLATLFHEEVGQSPKAVAMLMRFAHATARIAASVRDGATLDLANVAAATGYSDQAHLTREFVRYTGVPPRRWVAEEFRNIQDGGHSAGADCDYDCSESDSLADAASP
jgi:AraC-like DNA-binding protein